MSVGNLKTQGNKGNNFPYQLAVLKLLDQIITTPNCCPTASTEVTQLLIKTAIENIDTTLAPTVRTASFIRVSAIGTVLAGARSVSFYNSGTANATVSTGVLKSGEMISFDAGGQGDTLGAITYDSATNVGAELLITKVI